MMNEEARRENDPRIGSGALRSRKWCFSTEGRGHRLWRVVFISGGHGLRQRVDSLDRLAIRTVETSTSLSRSGPQRPVIKSRRPRGPSAEAGTCNFNFLKPTKHELVWSARGAQRRRTGKCLQTCALPTLRSRDLWRPSVGYTGCASSVGRPLSNNRRSSFGAGCPLVLGPFEGDVKHVDGFW